MGKPPSPAPVIIYEYSNGLNIVAKGLPGLSKAATNQLQRHTIQAKNFSLLIGLFPFDPSLLKGHPFVVRQAVH